MPGADNRDGKVTRYTGQYTNVWKAGDQLCDEWDKTGGRAAGAGVNLFSERIANCFLQTRSIIPAQGELFAALEDDMVLPMKPRLEFFDFVDPHNRRAMDAQEFLGIQLGLEPTDSLAQQIRLAAIVNAYVVAFRLDTVNVSDIKEKDAARSLHSQPFNISGAGFQLLEQSHDMLVASIELLLANLNSGPLPGGHE